MEMTFRQYTPFLSCVSSKKAMREKEREREEREKEARKKMMVESQGNPFIAMCMNAKEIKYPLNRNTHTSSETCKQAENEEEEEMLGAQKNLTNHIVRLCLHLFVEAR